MPFEKGRKKTGGRQKGVSNKTTEKARELFQSVMDEQQDKIKEALEEIYKEDKRQYLYVLNRYFPYYMPKQEQIDISNEDGSLTVNNNFKIEFREPNTDTASEI